MKDQRFVYSTFCTFHGPIQQARPAMFGIPGCPSCGSPLFEMPSQDHWDRQISEYAAKKNDPDYPAFMKWFGAQRPCRPFRTQADFDALRAEFNASPR